MAELVQCKQIPAKTIQLILSELVKFQVEKIFF